MSTLRLVFPVSPHPFSKRIRSCEKVENRFFRFDNSVTFPVTICTYTLNFARFIRRRPIAMQTDFNIDFLILTDKGLDKNRKFTINYIIFLTGVEKLVTSLFAHYNTCCGRGTGLFGYYSGNLILT